MKFKYIRDLNFFEVAWVDELNTVEMEKWFSSQKKEDLYRKVILFKKIEDPNGIVNLEAADVFQVVKKEAYSGQAELTFSLVDNFRGIIKPIEEHSTSGLHLVTMPFDKLGSLDPAKLRFFFSVNEIDSTQRSLSMDAKVLNCAVGDQVVKTIFLFDDEEEREFFAKNFSFNKEYRVRGFMMRLPVKRQGITLTDSYLIITRYSQIDDDYTELEGSLSGINNIQDFSVVRDFMNDKPVYSDLEVAIILSNIFYVEMKPVFHLILCGSPHVSKKSTWLEMYSRLLDEEIIRCENSRIAGMVPSYGDKKVIKRGAILSAKFCCLADEFLRIGESSEAGVGYNKSRELFVKMMGLFLKSKGKSVSGNTDFNEVFVNSFFATDNMTDKSQNYIRQMMTGDDAPLRRINFMVVSNETEQNIIDSEGMQYEMDYEELYDLIVEGLKKKGLTPRKFKMLLKYMRKSIHWVTGIDRKWGMEVQRKVKKRINIEEKDFEYSNPVKVEAEIANKIVLTSLPPACLKSAVVIRTILEWKDERLPGEKDFVVQKKDYDFAEMMIQRYADDKARIFSKALKNSSGIVRKAGRVM